MSTLYKCVSDHDQRTDAGLIRGITIFGVRPISL